MSTETAKPDFWYECATCSAKIPAFFNEPDPPGMQCVVTGKRGKKTETTFRCVKYHETEADQTEV